MAANSLVKSPAWSMNERVSSAQLNSLQQQAAQSVNRTNTKSGELNMPLFHLCSSSSTDPLIVASASIGSVGLSNSGWHLFSIDRLPDGHELTQVRAHIKPQSGLHAALPATMPSIELLRVSTTGEQTSLGSHTCSISSVATYEAGFYLSVNPSSEVVDLSEYRYLLKVTPEQGSNSYTLGLSSILVTMAIDDSLGGQDLSFWLK